MIEKMRKEIETIEVSAERLKALAEGNPAILRNTEAIMTFVYLLKFITPKKTEETDEFKRKGSHNHRA
jgi:hypothetical protein